MRRFREPISGFTHLGGALLAGLGLLWLVYLTARDPAKLLSSLVYGVSLILLYSASAALHLSHGSRRKILILQRLDHAAIYGAIAGTYTPLCYNVLDGGWRWGTLGAIWALAIFGAVYKLLFLQRGSHLSTFTYVAMGWLALLIAPHALRLVPPGVLWLVVAGGAAYSVGAVIFALEKPNFHPHFGFHEVWHLFVMAGSALHFIAVVKIL